MGVPKFYRWISERYPCLSEVVKEFQIPEFDNLYLDMNGIIHVCSHPDDDNPHFRIEEEDIFKSICHYIEHLFRMIKPRKVFFMAVDGVAPRAKMNQQRGRRFRSAREAETRVEKAKEKGEILPEEPGFDSNAITPGTPFMVRLQEHLKYFVVKKTSEDPLWQGPKIYLSGHECPGEGEHKVMDFIRFSKSQPDYDNNTRHCLYGLDADLIMLGLVSHEPHFSLLREEVRFGGKRDKNKRPMTPERTTFHLLHLSLMREYLGYEFSPLKGQLSFPWDLEKLIDDWVLMGFLVGNDFIPHLPHLHIHHNALPMLWKTYMTVLPKLDGYLNEGGHLNLPRFEKYFEELSKFDHETFENAFSDLKYLESKLGGKQINESAGRSNQKVKMRKLKPFKANGKAPKLGGLFGDADDSIDSEESDEVTEESEEEDYDTFDDEFALHKRDYYQSKMEYAEVTPEVLQDQAFGYVTAIQWVLLYYFEGVPSWSWFYPHHYAPYISDVKGFANFKIVFDMSSPFLPFQQLMAVLPSASKVLLPPALQPLMTEATSPVIDFYPVNFETDLNGKQQDWEAVVLIPFIEEERLLQAMASKEHLLSKEEKLRNRHGPHFMYQYTTEEMGFYPSPRPGFIPDIHMSRARRLEIEQAAFRIDPSLLTKGLLEGVRPEVYYPGFPTLFHLEHTHELKSVGVKVFQMTSRGESMLLRVLAQPMEKLEVLADKLLGKTIYVDWPHLHEARVIAVADESFKIELVEENSTKKSKRETVASFQRKQLDASESCVVAKEASGIKERLMDRFAIDAGKTEVVVYACTMTGRNYTYGVHGAITLEKQFASRPAAFALQMTVQEIEVEESGHTTYKTLDEVFPVDGTVFMLGMPHYGAQGKVLEILTDTSRVRIALDVKEEPDLSKLGHMHMCDRYLFSKQAAQQIGIDAHILSRITGSVFVEKRGSSGGGGKVNIGLNLKFTKRREEVPGYTRKAEEGWTYSHKCVETVAQYINSFPDLWTRVTKMRSDNDFFAEKELFPEDSDTKLSDVTKFLEGLACTKAPRMKIGSEILHEEQVKRIESMTATLKPIPNIVKMKIYPRLLFRPLNNQGTLVPDPEANFFLYDRVVVVKTGFTVPLGRRGTVIGIPSDEDEINHNSLYDVVFDEQFEGGMALRCSPDRGFRVPGCAMLNLTFGEFRKWRPPSERPTVGAWNGGKLNHNDGYHRQGPTGAGYNGPASGSNNNHSYQHPGKGQLSFNDRAGAYSERAASGARPQVWRQERVQWDERGQPLFGQVFQGGGQGVGKSKYEVPRTQTSKSVLSAQGTGDKAERTVTDNAEFDSMWKSLQAQQATQRQPGPTSSKLQEAASTLPKHPASSDARAGPVPPQPLKLLHKPTPQLARQPVKKAEPAHVPVVETLFKSASKVNAPVELSTLENAEFLAMFNSLKMQTSDAKQEKLSSDVSAAEATAVKSVHSTGMESSKQSSADNALKQLLKIGMDSGQDSKPAEGASDLLNPQSLVTPVPSTSSAPSQASSLSSSMSAPGQPSPSSQGTVSSYGRQVSLQELFDGAACQQQSSKLDHRAVEARDPQGELDNFCSSNYGSSALYEFKPQPKQMAYIANVVLPNGGRYEGSICKTKEEAAKSAASIAMLCLKTTAAPIHPLITGFMPRTNQRPNVARFFSPNSAFSPIGLGSVPPSLRPGLLPNPSQPPPPLLTPQHFINHPPPLLPHQQLYQQQQQQHQTQRFSQQSSQNFPHRPPQPRSPRAITGSGGQHLSSHSTGTTTTASSNSNNASTSSGTPATTSSVSSISQPFIPLQVSRNQKTPSRKSGPAAEGGALGELTPRRQSTTSTSALGKSVKEGSNENSQRREESLGSGLKETAAVVHQAMVEDRLTGVGESQDVEGAESLASYGLSREDTLADQTKNRVMKDAASSPASTAPPAKAKQKKKSRLAANFAKKT